MKRLLLIAVLVGSLVGCGAPPTPTPVPTPEPTPTPVPCNIQAADFIEEVEERFDDWDDTNRLAATTPRVQLSPLIGQLQEIRRDVSDLDYPECAQDPRDALLEYMDKKIDAYIAFLGQEDDNYVSSILDLAERRLEEWAEEWAKLKAGEEPYD